MHVPDQARETEDVSTLCHTWCNRCGKADWTACRLCLRRCQDLQDRIPFQMHVSVDRLRMITAVGLDNEAIVGVNVSCFVNGVIPRS